MADRDPQKKPVRAKTHQKRVRRRRNAAHARKAGAIGSTYGAIDLGTNNCRLLIATSTRHGFRVIDAFSRIVRLGEGMGHGRDITEGATERAIEALKVCSQKLLTRRVNFMRSVGTEACRLARNSGDFIDRVWEETGIAIDIISAEEEARLAVLGCQSLIDPERPISVIFDIGGGSTELAAVRTDGETTETIGWISLPYGVVRLAERLDREQLTAESFADLKAEIRDAARSFIETCALEEPIRRGEVQLLGSSGTVTTLSSLQLGLEVYDRSKVDGAIISREGLAKTSEYVATTTPKDRAAIPVIGEDRADLVVPGCAILNMILDAWPTETLTVADRGLREGILRSLMEQHGSKPHQSRKSKKRD